MSWCQSWAWRWIDSPAWWSEARARTSSNGSSARVRRFCDMFCRCSGIATKPPAGLGSGPMTANLASFAIHVDDTDRPAGFECTFPVDDVDAVKARVVASGGTITMDNAPIPTVGVLIRFLDTEGN